MQKGESDNYYTKLIATALAVDGSTIATTDLTFETGLNLSNCMPVFAIIKFASGTLGIAIGRIKVDGVNISQAITMSGLVANFNIVVNCALDQAITNDSTKFIQFTVATASLAASSFDVYVYGIQFK